MAYILNDKHRELLRNKRKMKKKSAENISEQIYKSKGWLAMVERGRIKSIALDDLKMLLAILDGSDSDATVRAFLDAADPESAQYKMVNHKSFSEIDPTSYASFDFERICHQHLTEFSNEVRRQLKTAEHDKRRYLILRAIEYLSKNIKGASDLTIVFNSAPFYRIIGDSTLEFATMQTALDLFDKCYEYEKSDPKNTLELKFNGAADDMHVHLTGTLELINNARSCLVRMLSAYPVSPAARDRYNETIRAARDMCYPVVVPRFEFPELDADKVLSDTIIGLQLGKLERLRDELTSVYNQYKEKENEYDTRMLAEMHARELYYLDHPEYYALDADEYDPENLQLLDDSMSTNPSEPEQF